MNDLIEQGWVFSPPFFPSSVRSQYSAYRSGVTIIADGDSPRDAETKCIEAVRQFMKGCEVKC